MKGLIGMKDWLKKQYANAKIAWSFVVAVGLMLGYNISLSITPKDNPIQIPTTIEKVEEIKTDAPKSAPNLTKVPDIRIDNTDSVFTN
jgi:hypothetical protein